MGSSVSQSASALHGAPSGSEPSAAERLFNTVRAHLIPRLALWAEQSPEWRGRYAKAAAGLAPEQSAITGLPGRYALGRAIYLALYEHQGAVWEANETPDVWFEAADRLRAMLTPRAPEPSATDGANLIERAAEKVYAAMVWAKLTPGDPDRNWVPLGNSLAQDEARRAARYVLALGRESASPAPGPFQATEEQ